MPEDARRAIGDEFVDAVGDSPYVLLVGFEYQPPNLYDEIERLGG